MKKIYGMIGVIIGVIGVGVIAFGIHMKVAENSAVSMSVIGGADGPTSIFLAGKLGNGQTTCLIMLGILFLAAGIFSLYKIYKNRINKK